MAQEIPTALPVSLTSDRETALQRGLFWAFLALLLWAPLPLGSNRAWAWGLLECWTFLLLAAWLVSRWQAQQPLEPILGPCRPVLLWMLLATLYPLWQIVPWPPSLLAHLSPTTLTLRQMAEADLLSGPISLDAHVTQVEWLKGMAYLGIFWLTLVLTPTRQRLRQLLWTLLGSGMLQVGINLLTASFGHDVRGSFVNRNHLAGFLELIIPVAIALLRSEHVPTGAVHSWKDRFYNGLQFISSANGLLVAATIALVSTLFLTQSRGGNGALLLALLLVAALARPTRGTSARLSRARLAVVLLMVSSLMGSCVGLGQLVGRYLDTDIQQEGRLAVLATAGQIAQEYPLFGSGSGTFLFVYPRYQHPAISHVLFDHAHNDHLEILTERGAVGYGLLAVAVLSSWWLMVRAYGQRRDPLAVALLYASLVATLSLTIHGLADFNFQIPVNALYFMVLLGLGLRGVTVIPARKRAS
ncbi:MAG: O-antigen ligase family protein [Magnetococcales bacterium]|nr:O-antigen ligase family protein [Magnetococcales bacterium]